MRLSHGILMADAGASGFRPDILEKCELLLSLLQGLADHPFLGPRLALKGAAALNLFVFDVPRLWLDASLLTDDPVLRERIQVQPGLHWKALNVRQTLGLES